MNEENPKKEWKKKNYENAFRGEKKTIFIVGCVLGDGELEWREGKNGVKFIQLRVFIVIVAVDDAFKCNMRRIFSSEGKNIICPVHFASFVCKRRENRRNQIKKFSTFDFNL